MLDNRKKIQNRIKINTAVRQFFSVRDYLEVETPCFVRSPDIEPTLTHLEATVVSLDGQRIDGAMITSPEYAIKKLVSKDLPRLFELARVFRNGEPVDDNHCTEFTMLEWYRLGSSFMEGVEETKDFVEYVGKSFGYDFEPWMFVTVEELFQKYCGIDSLASPTVELYKDALKSNNLDWQEDDTVSDLFQRLFLNLVQPNIDVLPNPIVVAYYPRHEATLSKINEHGFAERFEIYINGIEICNAYGELTDALEQRARFEAELLERKRLGKTQFPIDAQLLMALDKINRPMFGIALGVDRLLMVVAGVSSMEEVILFTTNKMF